LGGQNCIEQLTQLRIVREHSAQGGYLFPKQKWRDVVAKGEERCPEHLAIPHASAKAVDVT
jgi:hypothetical protein